MTCPRSFTVGAPLGLLLVSLLVLSAPSPAACQSSSLAGIEFPPEGAAQPDEAAVGLCRACIRRSPKQFVQHLCLGVCDGPIDTVRKFAECLHFTTFRHGEHAFTVYDLQELPKRMNPETVRAVASQAFTDEEVESLSVQFVTTYYGEQFMCFELAVDSYDGSEYRTRIVVTKVKDRWYAIPRCGSSRSFYQIADAMKLTVPESE